MRDAGKSRRRVLLSVYAACEIEYLSELKLWAHTFKVQTLLEGVIVSDAPLLEAQYVKREFREWDRTPCRGQARHMLLCTPCRVSSLAPARDF
jgi:hypothetical protein